MDENKDKLNITDSGSDENNIFFTSDDTDVDQNKLEPHTATNEMEAIFDELRNEAVAEDLHSDSDKSNLTDQNEESILSDSAADSDEILDDLASTGQTVSEDELDIDFDSDNIEDSDDEDSDSKEQSNTYKKRFGMKKEKKNKKRESQPVERARISFWQGLIRFIIIMACFAIILASVVGVLTALYLADATADDNKLLDLNQIKLSYATRLMAFDKEKQEWYEYERLYSDENRLWVEYGDLPQNLIKAVVASEDQRFWTHHGVDWKRTAFGFINEYIYRMSESTQGGSTITQQLIKNITSDKAVSGIGGVLRKLREIYRALELEKNYSKEQILEAYINTVGLGDQVAGIEAAANYYFGKHTGDLTMAESAAIICVTKYPSAYNPYLNPDENHRQRNYVLYNMFEYGMISEREYNMAKKRNGLPL